VDGSLTPVLHPAVKLIMLLSAYNIVYYLLSLSFTVILCIKIRPVHGLALKKTQKKGGKYINKLLRLQPAELKVENKRRKEKNLRLRIENDYLKNERLLLLL
jgi:hypothetical protein